MGGHACAPAGVVMVWRGGEEVAMEKSNRQEGAAAWLPRQLVAANTKQGDRSGHADTLGPATLAMLHRPKPKQPQQPHSAYNACDPALPVAPGCSAPLNIGPIQAQLQGSRHLSPINLNGQHHGSHGAESPGT